MSPVARHVAWTLLVLGLTWIVCLAPVAQGAASLDEDDTDFLAPVITLDFDRERLTAYADQMSWAHVNTVIKERAFDSRRSIGPWHDVSAILYTPAMLWVEAQYAAHLHGEDQAYADAYFRKSLYRPLDSLYFLVILRSTRLDALDADQLQFTLRDDRGNVWQTEFFLGRKISTQGFGDHPFYERVIDVVFYFDDEVPQWSEPLNVQLTVTRRKQGQESADKDKGQEALDGQEPDEAVLAWKLAPAPPGPPASTRSDGAVLSE